MNSTYAHNSSINDPESETHSYSLEGAIAHVLEKNVAAGEFVFEIEMSGRILQFRTNQEATVDNWVGWVNACSNEKRFQDTIKLYKQPSGIEEEDAEAILNDPVAIEKPLPVAIFARIFASDGDIVRRKLIDEIPKV